MYFNDLAHTLAVFLHVVSLNFLLFLPEIRLGGQEAPGAASRRGVHHLLGGLLLRRRLRRRRRQRGRRQLGGAGRR